MSDQTERAPTPIECLRQIRHHCDGNNWSGGESVYLSRKWIIKLCNDTISAYAAQPAAEPVAHGGRPMTMRECMEAEEAAPAAEPLSDALDAKRYRWLRDNVKEAPLRPGAYAAEMCPDTRLKYEIPALVSWADYMGQVTLDDAIDAAIAAHEAMR